MRSQSSGQGVLISKTKQQKQQAPVYSLQMAHSVQTDVQDSFSTSSQSFPSSVAVDPSLGRATNALNTTGDSLQAGINNVGDLNGVGNAGTNSQHTPNILITPYSSGSYQRSSFSFVNTNGNGHGHSAQGDAEAGGTRSDHSPQSLAIGSTFSAGDSPSPEPDSAEAQYRSVRLPPILQVEKQHVTTTATQAASATRRKNEAVFKCPVPGCGSTFTRRFNLRGHLRSHTEERPFVCDWPGCGKGFARSHDCKRHSALHTAKSGTHVCIGCGKTFSRTDALNRHLKSDVGAPCRDVIAETQTQKTPSRHGSAPPIYDGVSTPPQPISVTQMVVDSSPVRPVPFAT